MSGLLLGALRSAVLVLWMMLTLVPYASLALVVSLGLRGARFYAFCRGWMWLAIHGARVICGVNWRVQGREHLPDGPVILVSKHQSAWETLAYTVIMPKPLTFVFKRELLLIPFFGWAIARLDMIHIDRSRRTEAWKKVAEQGRRFLDQGNWVIMFPEGTRSPRGGQAAYKAGAARLAVETGAVLVPVAVTSAKCWPRNRFIKHPGTIEVSIGPPVPVADRNPLDLMRDVETWIEAEMRRLDPEAYEPSSVAASAPSVSSVASAPSATPVRSTF